MTTVFTERDLQLSIDGAVNARKFDDNERELQNCMKAVDFIIELSDSYLFIEFKDPQHPQATPQARQDFINSIESGGLDEDLKYKYRDTFLQEWASGRAEKPIYYLVLIGLDTFTSSELQRRTDSLREKLPVERPASWTRPIVQDCAVFNLDSWNERLPNFRVTRLSSQSSVC